MHDYPLWEAMLRGALIFVFWALVIRGAVWLFRHWHRDGSAADIARARQEGRRIFEERERAAGRTPPPKA
jgi:hypothetical protein